MTVIFKSGNPRLPQNYQPIAVIPVLYKLFARMLYNRLAKILEPQQSVDQAGFRPSFSTLDHLFTLAQVSEKAHEWQKTIWLAAIDFQKAFDTVEHASLWHALADQNVPAGYIRLLQKLHEGQKTQVRTDVESKSFDIGRGTKQGDPLSSLLFNALLE